MHRMVPIMSLWQRLLTMTMRQVFYTSSVEAVIEEVIKYEPKACIVVKSTIPLRFIDNMKGRLDTNASFLILNSCGRERHCTIICFSVVLLSVKSQKGHRHSPS